MTKKNPSVTIRTIWESIVGGFIAITGPMYGIILWDLWFDKDQKMVRTIREKHPSLYMSELKNDFRIKTGLTALSVAGVAIIMLIIALVIWGPLWAIIAIACIHLLFLVGYFILLFILLPEPWVDTEESTPHPPSPAAPAAALERSA